MEEKDAIAALAALAQPSRLRIFRQLVEVGQTARVASPVSVDQTLLVELAEPTAEYQAQVVF